MFPEFENEFPMPKNRLQLVTERRISSPTQENNYRNKFSRHFQRIREFKDPALSIDSSILHKFNTQSVTFDNIQQELRDQLAQTQIKFEIQNDLIKKKFEKKKAEQIDFNKLNDDSIPQLFTFEPQIFQAHSNTQFVFINQNIRRIEVINHLFPYNFSEEMRSNFKLAVLSYSKEEWIKNRNKLFIKVLKKFTILKDIVYKIAVYRIDKLNKPIQQLNLEMNDLSFKALFEVYQLGMIKMQINKLNFNQSANFKLLLDLNKMSYLVDPYLNNSSNKYICFKCGNIDFNCKCKDYDNLYSLCKLFNYRNSIIIQQKKKSNKTQKEWGMKYERDYTLEACGIDCFKLKIDDLEDQKVIQIDDVNIKIDNDLCILSRQNKISCSQLYNQFIINKRHNHRLLLERIQLIQRTFDQQTEEGRLDNYQPLLLPCRHDICDQNCLCNWVGCGKYCECKCDKKLMKCQCQICIPEECQCYKRSRECDPLLCGCCQENTQKLGHPFKHKYYKICWNLQILLNNKAPIWLGRSKVCDGYGVYAKQFIPKNRLITLYLGEVIHENEEEIMDQIEESPMFYLFKTTDERYSLEAKHFGNEARFINHSDSKLMNCEVQPMFSKNSIHLAIISSRDIEQQEELFINYKLENPDLFPWMRNVKQINKQQDLFKITKLNGPQMQIEQKFKFDKSILKQKTSVSK